jgi:hypothetical protein
MSGLPFYLLCLKSSAGNLINNIWKSKIWQSNIWQETKKLFWDVLIGLDQLVNVFARVLNPILNPKHKFGSPDETLSSVMGKNVRAGSCRLCFFMCRILNLVDPRHCQKSIEEDEGYK